MRPAKKTVGTVDGPPSRAVYDEDVTIFIHNGEKTTMVSRAGEESGGISDIFLPVLELHTHR